MPLGNYKILEQVLKKNVTRLILGGVIGAQIGVRIGSRLKAEYLRGLLAILVLAVCAKLFTDLVLQPNDLFSTQVL